MLLEYHTLTLQAHSTGQDMTEVVPILLHRQYGVLASTLATPDEGPIYAQMVARVPNEGIYERAHFSYQLLA